MRPPATRSIRVSSVSAAFNVASVTWALGVSPALRGGNMLLFRAPAMRRTMTCVSRRAVCVGPPPTTQFIPQQLQFNFPPNDPKHIPEFIRAQTYNLKLDISYFQSTKGGEPLLGWLTVDWNPTQA